MQRMGWFRVILCLVAGSITVTAAVDPAKVSFAKDILPLLEDHCYACHGDTANKAGAGRIPNGKRRPPRLRFGSKFVSWWPPKCRRKAGRNVPMVKSGTCWQIGRAIRWIPYRTAPPIWSGDGSAAEPGEYNNVVRDFVVDFKPAKDFPADDTGYGFDNIGDVLSMSPLLMEKYLDAAETIAAAAVVTEGKEPTEFQKEYFKLPVARDAVTVAFGEFVAKFMGALIGVRFRC